MRALRTYRFVPALLALSLMLMAATPLVRHSCAMMNAEMTQRPCCKGKSAHDAMSAMRSHQDSAEHGAMSHGKEGCRDAPASSDETPCSDTADWASVRAACCAHVEAPAAPAPERIQPLPSSAVALVAAVFALPTEPPPSPPRLLNDPSPPPPVALHLLHGSFLT